MYYIARNYIKKQHNYFKMKKISQLFIYILIANILFIGCTKEDSSTSNIPSGIHPVNGDKPTLTTVAIGNIGGVTAESGGVITSDGGLAVSASGVVWSTNPYPTTSYYKTTDGTPVGPYVSAITGLTPNTMYYVRAYATNEAGTSYGNQLTFTTTSSPVVPTITTTAISGITESSALSGGNVMSTGGATILSRGVVWGTTTGPTISNSKTVDGVGTGTFVSTLTGLTANTVYYVRAYATNSVGTAYGDEVHFTTLPAAVLPSITTTNISNITSSTATSGGYINSEGGAPVTARGVVWGTSQNPTVLNFLTTDGTGAGAFTSAITGLALNTTYYVRAYATNSVGTAYGNQWTIKYTIGSFGPGGGYVFMITQNNHGMEIIPFSKEVQSQWGCPISNIAGTSGDFGTGLANTNLIEQYHSSINYYTNPTQCNDTVIATGDVAALKCDNITFNGYTDWYMPSSAELLLAYTILKANGLGDFTTTGFLASSTQNAIDNTKIDGVDFSTGTISSDFKHNIFAVRAVRSY